MLEVPPPPPPPPEDSVPPPPDAIDTTPATSRQASRKPLNLEEIARQRKNAEQAAAKPRFVPKAEREKRALEKLAQEEEQRKAKTVQRFEVNNHVRRGGPPTGPAAMRQTGHGRLNGQERPTPPPSKKEKRPAADPEEVQTTMIRQRYMGIEQVQSTFSAKKKRKRTTEKKFNFEWDAEEDTSAVHDPFYQDQPKVNPYAWRQRDDIDDAEFESSIREHARLINERDPETGPARAQEMIELARQSRERGKKASFNKHWSEKKLEHMRERDWRIFKEDYDIATKGGSLPNPMRNWGESGLPKRLMEVVDKVGYTDPSPVQRAAIPIALQSRDLIGVAVTGSGKTAAFLLPLLVYISELPALNEHTKNDGPYALILAPTRELAQQIEIEARKFATPLGFTCVSIVGGHSLEEQAYNLRDGAEIIIATPGRLVDCIERRVLVLSQCCYVIMDEADRMIDLGFEEPVNKILDALPVGNMKPDTEDAENAQVMSQHLGGKDRYRQTMMYTATMPAAVERIARKYLRRPAIVTIGNVGEAVETVEQRVEFVAGEDKKKRRMLEILSSGEFKPPIIVFVNIKRNCDAVARDIKHMGFTSVTLHGSKTQDQREAALASVRNGTTDVLVATDLAGRGIDVQDVSLVMNFNMATSIESYTHRIGRTGRAGKSGVSITFLGNEDTEVMYELKQMLSKSSISRVPEELRRHEAAQQKSQRGQPKKLE